MPRHALDLVFVEGEQQSALPRMPQVAHQGNFVSAIHRQPMQDGTRLSLAADVHKFASSCSLRAVSGAIPQSRALLPRLSYTHAWKHARAACHPQPS
eukprot:10035134-Alexandrium_andersonii.AAC.1